MPRSEPVEVYFHTFGCKANQYDTERMRQELEARGLTPTDRPEAAQLHVLNTCTVTNQADAGARRTVRRLNRINPGARVVVAGCSAALHADRYRSMAEVDAVVPGHDPVAVATASLGAAPSNVSGSLVQLQDRRSLDRLNLESVGGELLHHRRAGTRGWLKIQDGCDRKCAFCATRLARGSSRSRAPESVLAEARLLARSHPEIVLTGIHIGQYGLDLPERPTLGTLVNQLLDGVPDVRFRLGSVEATEICDDLIDRLRDSGGRLAPHLHMPLQSGADPVLRRMRRWHTREQYRARTVQIAERLPTLGLGADIITGFPGETAEDHARTVALVEELPFTYLHVFPFSPRDDTVAAGLHLKMPVAERIAGERSRELRELVQAKAERYERGRAGGRATVVIEGADRALTGDYLRVALRSDFPGAKGDLAQGVLQMGEGGLYIEPVAGEPSRTDVRAAERILSAAQQAGSVR